MFNFSLHGNSTHLNIYLVSLKQGTFCVSTVLR